jgi:hypothetical protein
MITKKTLHKISKVILSMIETSIEFQKNAKHDFTSIEELHKSITHYLEYLEYSLEEEIITKKEIQDWSKSHEQSSNFEINRKVNLCKDLLESWEDLKGNLNE